MKIVKMLLVSASVLIAIVSCDKKEESVQEPIRGETVDAVELNVSFNTVGIDSLWSAEWKNEWQYDWSDSVYGTLGYTMPQDIKSTIYNIDSKTGNRYNHYYKIFDASGGKTTVYSDNTYDMLFYNFGTENITFNSPDDYQTYTAQSSYLGSADELLGAFEKGLYLYPFVYSRDLEVSLEPYNYIYLFQIIMINNISTDGHDLVVGASSINLTGLAEGVDLYTRTPLADTVSLTTRDIKPLQNHESVRLPDGTTAGQAGIMASRILTWGLPENGKKTVQNNLIIDLTLGNGVTFRAIKDVTNQLKQNPKGGVITICIDVAGFIYDVS